MKIINKTVVNQNEKKLHYALVLFGLIVLCLITYCFFESKENCIKYFNKHGLFEVCGEMRQKAYFTIAFQSIIAILFIFVGILKLKNKRRK